MTHFEKNISNFKIDIPYDLSLKSMVTFDEDIQPMRELDFDKNRSFFILLDVYSLEYIEKIFEELNEKSVVLLHYKKKEDLALLLDLIDFTQEKYVGKIILAYGDIRTLETQKRMNKQLKMFSINLTNIQPIVKISNVKDYIVHSKELLKFVRKFRKNYYFMLGNDLNDTLIGIHNRIRNTPKFIKNPGLNTFIKEYSEVYKNKPAVIVSSGPSLNKNIMHLKDYQDEVLILSCDGSLSTLLSNGIIPDIIGSVERIYKTYEAFYKNKNIDSNITVAVPAVVRPEIINKFDNKKIFSFFKSNDVYGEWFNKSTLSDKGTIYCGSSVAHLLMNLARRLGCNPIILIGQDLAYSKTGLSHASEVEIKETIELNKINQWVEGIDGDKLPSTSIWKQFLHTFEDMIQKMNQEVIDATEGGALIKGTTVKPLKEALIEYCEGNKLPRFQSLLEEINVTEKYIREANENHYKSLFEGVEKFDSLLNLVLESLKENEKSLEYCEEGIESQEQLDYIYDCIEKVDKDIVKLIAKDTFYMMLFQYPIYSTVNAINSLNSNEFTFKTINFNLNIHKSLLQIIEINSKKAIKVFIDGIKDVHGAIPQKYIEKYDFIDDQNFAITLN